MIVLVAYNVQLLYQRVGYVIDWVLHVLIVKVDIILLMELVYYVLEIYQVVSYVVVHQLVLNVQVHTS